MESAKILVVDDEPDIRETLRDVLELSGYTVTVACDGREGLLLLKKVRPDLVLLDIMMPNCNGWDFIDQQKADKMVSGIPVVVMSAFKESAKTIKAKDFISKPISLEKLLASVAKNKSQKAEPSVALN